jgi:hypothetical protein
MSHKRRVMFDQEGSVALRGQSREWFLNEKYVSLASRSLRVEVVRT